MNHHASRRQLVLATVSAALLPLALPARAQAWPDKPIKLTVGFAPGTGPDLLTRALGQQLGETMKTPLVIDNKTGAGGQIAANTVAKSPPDGYTLLVADVGAISIAPAAFPRLPYKPAEELVPITELARVDFVLIVPASSPARSLAEFVAQAAASSARKKVNFGTFGAGTPGHFGAEVLGSLGNFKIEAIHYRATGDAVTGVGSGEVDAALFSTPLAAAQLKGGKMRALAITSPTRSPMLPEVPTFAELGMPRADFSAWFCLFAPARTPAAVLATLNAQAVAAMQAPEVRKRLEEGGFAVLGTPQAAAAKMVEAETARWARIVQATGFKGE